MKRFFSLCLAVLMCFGLVCAVVQDAKADDTPVKKDGRAVSSADDLRVYEVVTFGAYPLWSYDDYADMEWIVLRKSGNRVTLLSRYVIDSRPFHMVDEKVLWQTCDLNVWLNDAFKSTAFTTKELNLINGSITLPSISDARAMPKDLLYAEFTPFAIASGGDGGRGIWWLCDGIAPRMRKGEEINCASVVQQGEILEASYRVDLRGKGVRPLLQIDFDRQGDPSEPEEVWYTGATGPLMKGSRAVFSVDGVRMYDDVTFGVYPQDSFGDESPIHWIVIGKSGNRIKLLSSLALDSQRYQEPYAAVSWRFSSLNGWLNETFRDTAFTAEEQELLTSITLLSEEEAKELPDEYRITRSTEYAISQGADPKRCIWWLRDSFMQAKIENGKPTSTRIYCASVVLEDGEIGDGYYIVNAGQKTVRPVIVIDLSRLVNDLS